MSLINCEKCGKEIPDNSKFCNECGYPVTNQNEQQVIKKEVANNTSSKKCSKTRKKLKLWHFVVAAISVIILIVTIVFAINLIPQKYNWNDILLKSALPEPESNYGYIDYNDADYLRLTVDRVSFSQYEKYVQDCIAKGFTYIIKSDANSYNAFNDDSYELELDYDEDEKSLDISIYVRVSGTIKWSNSELAASIPVPKSNVGSILRDYTYGYEAYIGDISHEDYNDYILECESMGYNLDIQKLENAFYAKNNSGHELIVEYFGCDLIHIDLDVPEDVSDEEDSSDVEETEKEETKQTDTEATEKDNSSENVSNSKLITKKKAKSVVEELLEKDLEASIKITKLYFNEEKQGCYVEFEANNSADAAAVHLTTGKIDYKSEFNYYSEEAKRLRSQTPINEQKLHECNQKILNSSYAEWSFSITVIENDNNASKNGWEKIK